MWALETIGQQWHLEVTAAICPVAIFGVELAW